jgi:hypothetical protein
MPSPRRLARLLPLLSLVTIGALGACGDETSTPAQERYVLALTGLAERPNPVTTTANASAVLTVTHPDTIEYLIYAQGDSITASHIHAADATANGPIMVFTFGGPVIGRVDGVFRFGHITRNGTFSGAFTYDSVLNRMRAGTAYLNIHTRRYPAGEVRGQIVR